MKFEIKNLDYILLLLERLNGIECSLILNATTVILNNIEDYEDQGKIIDVAWKVSRK